MRYLTAKQAAYINVLIRRPCVSSDDRRAIEVWLSKRAKPTVEQASRLIGNIKQLPNRALLPSEQGQLWKGIES